MNTNSKMNLRDKLKESTREAILEAAVSVIISNENDMRMEDVAEKAGVAIGTLYNYFGNRQLLIDTIIEKRRKMAEDHIRQSLAQTAGQDVAARLEKLFQTLQGFLARHRTVTHHALQAKEADANSPGQKSLTAMLNEHVSDILQEAVQREEIRPEDMDLYPLVISGYLKGIFALADDSLETGSRPDFAKRLAELFLNGAARRS
ncbi:MAG TPA: TetR/AcrR family transcriptional regulator [Candidatus Syntrophosphaera sp.]|nr:TetR/AcrR family transcriptional regulator [Candidatus Syntrophosphaera sp.]